MRRIDARTVELTDHEIRAQEHLDAYLDSGQGIPFAASLALNRTEKERGCWFTGDFIHHLSDGTCQRRGRRVHVNPEWQHPVHCAFDDLPHECAGAATHRVWSDVGLRWNSACRTAARHFEGSHVIVEKL